MNDEPAIATYDRAGLFSIVSLESDGERLVAFYAVVNPDKLRHLAAAIFLAVSFARRHVSTLIAARIRARRLPVTGHARVGPTGRGSGHHASNQSTSPASSGSSSRAPSSASPSSRSSSGPTA